MFNVEIIFASCDAKPPTNRSKTNSDEKYLMITILAYRISDGNELKINEQTIKIPD